jgi:hypothetical protein
VPVKSRHDKRVKQVLGSGCLHGSRHRYARP